MEIRPSERGCEWAQTALLGANLVWTTLSLGGYLPRTLLVTAGLTIALLAVHFFVRIFSSRIDGPLRPFHPAGWALLPFLAYALANVLWVTPVPWLGWQDWWWWAQSIAVFWVVLNGIRTRGPRSALVGILLALGVVAVALACYQRYVQPDWLMLGRKQALQFIGRASGPFGIPNSLGGFLLLLIPLCLAFAFSRRTALALRVLFGWLTLVFLLGLGLTISRGAWIACVLALTVWPLFSPRWKLGRRLAFAVGTLLVLSLGSATAFSFSSKLRERFGSLVKETGELSRPIVWRAAWLIFRENPVVGGGAGSFNILFERHRPAREQTEPQWAHNDYLNTLSDYGAVGFALCFGAVGWIVWRARRQPEETPAAAGRTLTHNGWLDGDAMAVPLGIGLLAFGFQLAVDFHFKIPALALAGATVAALAVSQAWPLFCPVRDDASGNRLHRLALAAIVAVVLVGGAGWILPRIRGEALRSQHREELDRLARPGVSAAEKVAVATRAHEGFGRALALDAGNSQTWADRAYAAAIIAAQEPARAADLGREAENDARRALAQARAVPEFWWRLGIALDMQQRWVLAGDAFNEGLRLAPTSRLAWFHQAYHLALNPVTVPLARAAVATCLRLDPSNPEAEALRRHLSAGR